MPYSAYITFTLSAAALPGRAKESINWFSGAIHLFCRWLRISSIGCVARFVYRPFDFAQDKLTSTATVTSNATTTGQHNLPQLPTNSNHTLGF